MKSWWLWGCALAWSQTVEAPRVAETMRALVDAHEIRGAVTLVATRGGVIHRQATGFDGPSGHRPLRPDTIFWIASMTKPITGTAIMMLEDEGKLRVEDSVSKYLPEFAGLRTPEGRPANLTLQQLMTHTSGLGEFTPQDAKAARTLAELVPAYCRKPMLFEPGTKWKYCQSGINALGRIVEVVSGMSFDRFLEQRLLRPLGMKDTTFYPTARQLRRVAIPYRHEANGRFTPAKVSLLELQGGEASSRQRYPAANGGLYSTADDYGRFARMLLNGGQLDGRRYLSAGAIRKMTTIHTPGIKAGFTPGTAWGLTWCVVREAIDVSSVFHPGTYGHGGAYGTQAWIDPVQGVALILMVQRANWTGPEEAHVRQAFQQAVYARMERITSPETSVKR